MPEKKSLESLINKVETIVENVDSIDSSLDETMNAYKKTIGYTKDILDMLNKQKEKFTVLQKEAHELLEK
tara:strand:+ start:17 stop:226 length:210 start_codon:yes stop_codon:yes gene_type:complete